MIHCFTNYQKDDIEGLLNYFDREASATLMMYSDSQIEGMMSQLDEVHSTWNDLPITATAYMKMDSFRPY